MLYEAPQYADSSNLVLYRSSSAFCVVNERVIVPRDAVPLGKHQVDGDRRLKNVCTIFTVIFAYRSKERGTHPKKRRITSLTGSISRSYWSRFP